MGNTAVAAGARRHPGVGTRVRLRFVLYVAAFLLPLAGATFAFARYAADEVRDRADGRLSASLRVAVRQYEAELEISGGRASALAAQRQVQTALAEKDRQELRRVASVMPGVAFYSGGELLAGSAARGAAVRSVDVRAGSRRLGRIVVSTPLDQALINRIGQAVDLTPGDVLLLGRGTRVLAASSQVSEPLERPESRPDDVQLGGELYRGLSIPLVRGAGGAWLAVLTTKSAVAQASDDVQRRILLAGLVTIAAVALLGYAVAPAIARSRLSQHQRAQAERVLAQVGDGVIFLDPDGIVLLWNAAAEAITGLTADAVLGRRIDEIVPGWPTVEERVHVARNATGRRPAQVVPLEIGGRDLWLSISGVESSDGRVYTFRDLTEEHRLEKAKSDFVSTVSHELRTPLASIHGAAMTLQRHRGGLTGDIGRQLLNVIAEQSDRLSRLVEQILLAGRLDSGKLDVSNESFDAAKLTRAVVEATRVALPGRLTLEVRSPDSLPLVVGDPDRARQVLSNLLENAIKYSPDEGRIEVELFAARDGVRFSVRDGGLGIPAGEHERIFEKFYRLDPEMSRGIGGSGLGLYICRELVRRMDGHIWVNSRVGAGSTFSFVLPLARAVGGGPIPPMRDSAPLATADAS